MYTYYVEFSLIMARRTISKSELIINSDGSIFHLHLLPGQLSEKIILVGDPERVTLVAKHLAPVEVDVRNREFHTVTGYHNGKRVSVVSHGIGTDNIDIVLTEIDALFNINFETRQVNPDITILTLIRVGTSGSLQPYLPVGSHCISEVSIGLDSVLHYYGGADRVIDNFIASDFVKKVSWNLRCGHPYAVHADEELVSRFADLEVIDESHITIDESGMAMMSDDAHNDFTLDSDPNRIVIHRGMTLSAVGFYGPQGRELRLPLASPDLNSQIERFSHDGRRVTNYEMESSALTGLAALFGHKSVTICTIIANRFIKTALPNYQHALDNLIIVVLNRI